MPLHGWLTPREQLLRGTKRERETERNKGNKRKRGRRIDRGGSRKGAENGQKRKKSQEYWQRARQ